VNADLTRLQNYLNVDPKKLQAKGVKSVRSRVCNLTEFVPELTCASLRSALIHAYEAEYGAFTLLTDADIDQAALACYVEKQRSREWRLGETPRFDREIRERFPWGGVQLLLTLRKGRVDSIKAYSDAIDTELTGEIEALLTGVEYDAQSMAGALMQSEKAQIRDVADFIREMEF